MIFSGGMIPSYIVMRKLGLTNTLWSVILLPAINVYNLVLMRNFFEGIPQSLFESATLDGCTPMQTFLRIGPAFVQGRAGIHRADVCRGLLE